MTNMLRTNGDSARKNGPETRRQPRPALTTTRRNRAMANRSDITPELCRQLLRYEPETGKLFWLPRPLALFSDTRSFRTWNSRFADAEAFINQAANGYRQGTLSGVVCLAHRVAWAIHHGAWPNGQIDHINGERDDNRMSNLRDVSRSINQRNRTRNPRNSSGANGVYLDRRRGLWVAEINIDGGRAYLGSFLDIDDARAARCKAERLHGYTLRHGQ